MTDSNKWKDPWFENLKPEHKLVWLFLLDDCDHAGIWQKSLRRLNYNCSTNLTEQEFNQLTEGRICDLGNDKIYIHKFCEFQYGTEFYKSNNPAVKKVIEILKKEGVIKQDNTPIEGVYIDLIKTSKGPIKGLERTFEALQEQEQEEVEEKDQVQVQDKIQEEDKAEVKDQAQVEIKSEDQDSNLTYEQLVAKGEWVSALEFLNK